MADWPLIYNSICKNSCRLDHIVFYLNRVSYEASPTGDPIWRLFIVCVQQCVVIDTHSAIAAVGAKLAGARVLIKYVTVATRVAWLTATALCTAT